MPREKEKLMPEPQEQTPEERRFERIENSQETTAESLARLYTLVGQIGDGTKALLTAQVVLVEAQGKTERRIAHLADALTAIAEAQAKSDLAQAETQGKLDALIHMWDESIRERGAIQARGEGEPYAVRAFAATRTAQH